MSSPLLKTATFAGGCFWGMEDLLRKLPGVVSTEVGYAGGTTENPTYEQVKRGTTGHAEAIQLSYDSSKLSYDDLIRFFFRIHDPTTINRQGNDIGTQYRSVIFYHSEEQHAVAKRLRAEAFERWKRPIVTEIVAAPPFTSAESYHQDYLEKNPGGYTCHFVRD